MLQLTVLPLRGFTKYELLCRRLSEKKWSRMTRTWEPSKTNP